MPATSLRTVLYVEDDRINIILMEEALRTLPGWRIDVVEDGRHAIERLQQLQAASALPDLVLIDMHLPDMSGIELLGKIRAIEALQSLNCVAMSADDQSHVVNAAKAAGFSDFWVKPITQQRFKAFAA